MADYQPVRMYRKLWSELTPSTGASNRSNQREKRNGQKQSLADNQKNLDKIRAHIRKRLSKTTQRRYIRNPVSSIRSVSGRRRSKQKSGRRPVKPWYSDGYPELRRANDVHIERQKQNRNDDLRRKKSIYFDKDGDDVPYYRSKSVGPGHNARHTSTYTPVINERDVINKIYTGDDITPPPRPSSLPWRRKRRDSGPSPRLIKHVLPHQRRSHSVGRLQTDVFHDVTKLYTDLATADKERHMRSNLSRLPREHHNLRFMKLDPEYKAELTEAFRNIERLKRLSLRYQTDAQENYSTRRSSRDPIETKFERLKKSRPSEVPIYMQNRSFTKLKLDPIEKPTDTRNDKRRRKSSMLQNTQNTVLPDVHNKSNKASKKTRKVESLPDSGVGTEKDTDVTTLETMSTAVIHDNESPIEVPNTINGQLDRMKRKPSTKRPSPVSKLHDKKSPRDTLRKRNSLTKGAGACGRKDSTVGANIKTKHKSKPIVHNKPDIVDSKSIEGSTMSGIINEFAEETIVRDKTEKLESERRKEIDESPYTEGPDFCSSNLQDTVVNYYPNTEENTGCNGLETSSTSLKQELNICEETNNLTRRDNGITDKHEVDQTNINKIPKSEESSQDCKVDSVSRRTVVTRQKLDKRESAYDVVVNRDEYENKGHKIAEKVISDIAQGDSVQKEIGRQQNTNNALNHYPSSGMDTQKTTEVTEHEIIKVSENTDSPKDMIHWKQLVSKHGLNSSVKHVTDKQVTVKQREETVANGNPGHNQWRDLVQKYLKQPVPKIGKTQDRLLLETEDDDEDDEDIDIFERARQKYSLNIDSDDSGDI